MKFYAIFALLYTSLLKNERNEKKIIFSSMYLFKGCTLRFDKFLSLKRPLKMMKNAF